MLTFLYSPMFFGLTLKLSLRIVCNDPTTIRIFTNCRVPRAYIVAPCSRSSPRRAVTTSATASTTMNDTATSAGPSTKREDAPSPIESDSEKTTKEPPKKKQKRTKKSPPDYAAMARDFPQRIVAASSKAIGYHASASGGAETAPFNALKTGSTAFALFLSVLRLSSDVSSKADMH